MDRKTAALAQLADYLLLKKMAANTIDPSRTKGTHKSTSCELSNPIFPSDIFDLHSAPLLAAIAPAIPQPRSQSSINNI
ncbi:hypothetical protein [Phormidium sp. CCY1219]|uniref:hypothetical protein n=1 Tax=Phormidium sp. CCY1219 TaxID=2886104 RepID=UPI002D1ECC9F|nr:hypothetical protein [Phormidium sp. CCY1219]MEB3830975.1 hypothetical protein [Phormidium sp. CCY1219]